MSLAQALAVVSAVAQPLGDESLAVAESYNRVLAEDVFSEVQLPPADASAVDGYALLSGDTLTASPQRPALLRVSGEIQAGALASSAPLASGQAIRIMTGAHLPAGADAVAKFEDTREEDGRVQIMRPLARHANCRFAGENLSPGELVLAAGERIGPANFGILSALDRKTVRVHRRPRVAIISTGDEVAGLGQDLGQGQIRDVNASYLMGELTRYNALPRYLGIAKDSLAAVRQAFAQALEADLVISTGGVSRGKYDFVRQVHQDLGLACHLDGVNIRPGKSCLLGSKDGKLVFSLPGHSGSTVIAFTQLARLALLRLMGQRRVEKPVLQARLEQEILIRHPAQQHFLMGYFSIRDGEPRVALASQRKSALFSSMSRFNCLIIAPEGVDKLAAGELVSIQLTQHEEI